MTRKFSLAHLTVLGCTPPEMTYIAADAGYDYVGYRIIPLEIPGEPRYLIGQDKALFRDTRAALRETGLELLDIEVARLKEGIDVNSYLPALEAAGELGAKHVIVSGWSQDADYTVDNFRKLCLLAEPFGLTVDFEFITFYPYGTMPQVWEVVQKAGRPNGGVLVDTLHYDRSLTTFEQVAAIPPDRFHFAQLCDAPKVTSPTREEMIATARGERLFLGEGDIPVKAILAHLPEMPYSLEVAHLKRQQEMGYANFARACLEAAKRYFADA